MNRRLLLVVLVAVTLVGCEQAQSQQQSVHVGPQPSGTPPAWTQPDLDAARLLLAHPARLPRHWSRGVVLTEALLGRQDDPYADWLATAVTPTGRFVTLTNDGFNSEEPEYIALQLHQLVGRGAEIAWPSASNHRLHPSEVRVLQAAP